MTGVRGPRSAREIAAWVAVHVDDEPSHVARVVTNELHRWNSADEDSLRALVEEPLPVGDERWDALLEGAVAYVLRLRDVTPPEWTRRTTLDEGFDPYADIHQSVTALVNFGVLDTPGELLNKGVIFSRKNFERL